MTMNRRRFLFASTAFAGSAMSTELLSAFAQEDSEPTTIHRKKALASAAERAVRQGKPLLVMVVPKEEREWWATGQLLGGWLNHASDDMLADLLLCEPVCASLEDLDVLMPGIGSTQDEPTFVLIDVATKTALHLTPILPEPIENIEGESWSDRATRQKEADLAGVDAISAAVSVAIRGEDSEEPSLRLRSRAAAASLALGEARLDSLLHALDERRPVAGALLDDGAAVVRLRIHGMPDRDAAPIRESLVARARERFVSARIPGAKWGLYTGCGTKIEGEEETMRIACGMGMTPPLGARFLYLFTE